MRRPPRPASKIPWEGRIESVQPRIRLLRSFDQRHHNYLGYVLRLDGLLPSGKERFMVAIGKAAQVKHSFRIGDSVRGLGQRVADPQAEIADLYKVSKLAIDERGVPGSADGPPYHDLAPALEMYRERGHRRLDPRTYSAKCETCVWGCRMPVEIILDQWNPNRRQYRVETFCYGPLSCSLYKAGQPRKVQGRKPAMVWVEEDWVDEEATGHRGPDD